MIFNDHWFTDCFSFFDNPLDCSFNWCWLLAAENDGWLHTDCQQSPTCTHPSTSMEVKIMDLDTKGLQCHGIIM